MSPCNFPHCALWFLLSAVSDRSCLFSPCTVISLLPSGHNVPVYKPLVTFPDCQCILSLIAHYTQVLKDFSANTHKAMQVTFLLLSSSQGAQKTSCFNIKLPCSEMFSLSLPFAHPHSCSGFVQCSAQGSCVLWPQLPRAARLLKKAINEYKTCMKSKAREQASSLRCWNAWHKGNKENANLCHHVNARNSKNNSNPSDPTLRPSKSCVCQSFPVFFYVL